MGENILVVDDEKDICRLLKTELELEGYSVIIATSGALALNEIQKINFDLAFMDVRMPDMSGMDLLKEIRKIKPDQKIIMMTAYDDPVYQEEAAKLGVVKYLFKPFPPETITKMAKEVLAKKK